MLASNLERRQLEGFRRQLGARAAELRRRVAEIRSSIPAAKGGEVLDTKEQAAADAAAEVNSAELERDRAELADIQLAEARIDLGTYGMCCDCGRTIARRRLKAYPTAKRCHDCQQAYEQATQLA